MTIGLAAAAVEDEVMEPLQVRSERCACGDVIFAPDLVPMIAAAVAVHVRGTRHASWAVGMGYRRPGPGWRA